MKLNPTLLFFLAFAAFAAFAGLLHAAESAPRTNVLVIILDQLHAQALGCAGNPIVKTPNFDRLAKQGVRFAQAFVPVPYCSPTRAAMVTGLCPSSLGIGRNIDAADDPTRLRDPRQIYQSVLAAGGYHCHYLGKWHLGALDELSCFPDTAADQENIRKLTAARHRTAGNGIYDDGLRDGETELIGDVYMRSEIAAAHKVLRQQKNLPKQDIGIIGRSRVKPEFHSESLLADYCIELLKRHREEPFAITYSVSPPHAPWIAPAPYYDMYDPKTLPLPASWRDEPVLWKDQTSAKMGRIYGEAGFREYLRCYYAQITMMDTFVGRILDALDELKLSDHTMIVFTSDHGNMLGQHGMMDKSFGGFYDDLMRVPLIMRLPGALPAGKTSDALVTTMDIAPTILDYLGMTPLAKTHGRSLRKAIAGNDPGYTAVFGERAAPQSPDAARMIRTKEWKLCLHPRGVRELFDLTSDADETRNLADDPARARLIGRLEHDLRDHMQAVGDPAAARFSK